MQNIPTLREVKEVQIHKSTNAPFSKDGAINLPAMMIPSFRFIRAKEMGVEKKLMIRTHGGLGDVICAEPAIRWAVQQFKKNGTEITLDTYFPELFSHLEFKDLNDTKKKFLKYDDYLVFDSLHTETVIHWEFLAAMYIQVVDHHSLVMWRSQLPIADKSIRLEPTGADYTVANQHIRPETDVIIHAGRTWQSRTVPTWFWNKIIDSVKRRGYRPVLIGKESRALVGNLPVETEGCLDLRDKLSVMETVAVLHRGKVVLTNDSSPIHMAASGDAWVGFISTVKFPEFITHWRRTPEGKTEFGWRMENFSKGGMWELTDRCPNGGEAVKMHMVDQKLVDGWMPNPEEYTEWAISRIHQ